MFIINSCGCPQVFSNHVRLCRERNCLLKEAEVLHKARFNYIIQIFGVCNEPEFFCIVTEFMTNGSLDELLHEVTCTIHIQFTWQGFLFSLVLMVKKTNLLLKRKKMDGWTLIHRVSLSSLLITQITCMFFDVILCIFLFM